MVVRDEYRGQVGPWRRWLQAGLPAVLDLARRGVPGPKQAAEQSLRRCLRRPRRLVCQRRSGQQRPARRPGRQGRRHRLLPKPRRERAWPPRRPGGPDRHDAWPGPHPVCRPVRRGAVRRTAGSGHLPGGGCRHPTGPPRAQAGRARTPSDRIGPGPRRPGGGGLRRRPRRARQGRAAPDPRGRHRLPSVMQAIRCHSGPKWRSNSWA
jgi:hypothetical protein